MHRVNGEALMSFYSLYYTYKHRYVHIYIYMYANRVYIYICTVHFMLPMCSFVFRAHDDCKMPAVHFALSHNQISKTFSNTDTQPLLSLSWYTYILVYMNSFYYQTCDYINCKTYITWIFILYFLIFVLIEF